MRINHTIIMLAAGLAMIALVGCGDSGSTTPEAQEWERSLEEIREAQAELERNLEELEAEISVRGTDDRPAPQVELEAEVSVRGTDDWPPSQAEGDGQTPVSGDICERSPAVQNALIEKLQLPSCQIINERELLRVTALKISSSRELRAGDLDGLYNLEGLSLSMAGPPPPGMLAGLYNLESLKLSMAAPPPPGMLAGLGNLSRIEMSFQAGEEPWRVEGHFPELPDLLSLSLNVHSVENAESEGMIVGDGNLAGMPSLNQLVLRGVRDLQEGALSGLPELRTVELRAHNIRDTHNSLVNRPALPPGLFQSLPELESIQAEGFRWPFGEGLELNSHKQVCEIGHNFGGYNSAYYPRKAGGMGSEMRVRVDGKPVGIISSNVHQGVCRIGTGQRWPGPDERWETEVLVDMK